MISETRGIHFEFPYRNADLVKITDRENRSVIVPFDALVEAINSQVTEITDKIVCANCPGVMLAPEA